MTTTKNAQRRSLQETQRIYETLLKRATLVHEGFPTLLAGLEDDIRKLTEQREALIEERAKATGNIELYTKKLDNVAKAIRALDTPPPPRIKRVAETAQQKRTRLMRELAELDKELA